LNHQFLKSSLVHSGAADYRAACRIGGVSSKPQCSFLRRYPIRPLALQKPRRPVVGNGRLSARALAHVDECTRFRQDARAIAVLSRKAAHMYHFFAVFPIQEPRCSLFRNRWSRPLDSLSAGTKTTQHVGTNECHETKIISPANQGHLVNSY